MNSAIRCLLAGGAAAVLSGCLFTADEIDPVVSVSGGVDSPEALFKHLEDAYTNRSLAMFETLLADDYQFQADAASLSGSSESTWGKDVEKNRHARMFQAIQNVNFNLQWDRTSPRPELAPRETTWTVYSLEMTMEYDGTPYDVRGQADFRLRAVPQADGSNVYTIVKWTDRNQ